jgi:hypothetical protein
MAGFIFLSLMGDYSASLDQARSKGAAMVQAEESVEDNCSEISLPPIS